MEEAAIEAMRTGLQCSHLAADTVFSQIRSLTGLPNSLFVQCSSCALLVSHSQCLSPCSMSSSVLRLEEVCLLHSLYGSAPSHALRFFSLFACPGVTPCPAFPSNVLCKGTPDCLANGCSCISDMVGNLLVTSCCVLGCPEASFLQIQSSM